MCLRKLPGRVGRVEIGHGYFESPGQRLSWYYCSNALSTTAAYYYSFSQRATTPVPCCPPAWDLESPLFSGTPAKSLGFPDAMCLPVWTSENYLLDVPITERCVCWVYWDCRGRPREGYWWVLKQPEVLDFLFNHILPVPFLHCWIKLWGESRESTETGGTTKVMAMMVTRRARWHPGKNIDWLQSGGINFESVLSYPTSWVAFNSPFTLLSLFSHL